MDSIVTRWDRTLLVRLPDSVKIVIRYETSELRGDTLIVHPDIYSRIPGDFTDYVVAFLSKSGLDAGRINRSKLAQLVSGIYETRRILVSSFIR